MQIIIFHWPCSQRERLNYHTLFFCQIASPEIFVLQSDLAKLYLSYSFFSENSIHGVPLEFRLLCYFALVVLIRFELGRVLIGYHKFAAHELANFFVALTCAVVDVIARNELDSNQLWWVRLIVSSEDNVFIDALHYIGIVPDIINAIASRRIETA